jgi:hypothetical protein
VTFTLHAPAVPWRASDVLCSSPLAYGRTPHTNRIGTSQRFTSK